jgi:CotH kinase protein
MHARPLLICITAIGGAVLCGAVRAQFGPTRDVEIVERYDQDGDGYLDREERDLARGRRASTVRSTAPRGPVNAMVAADAVETYGDEGLYDPAVLRTLFIEFEYPDWESELEAFYGTDVEVPATLTVDGKVYEGVGIHFRGNTSYQRVPSGRKRGLNISIDHFDDDQRLLGYRTLNLHNGFNDPTFLRNVLYLQIANAYYPAPKANFVRAVINGEDWGIYANVQQFNSDFTREAADSNEARWRIPGSFSSRGGLEYLGDNVAAYQQTYEIKNKDRPENWEALMELTRVLNRTPPEELAAALEPILDVDNVLRFLAVDNALANTDGYWSRNSDYSIYLDEDGRFHVSAYDANEALQQGEGGFGFRGGASAGVSLSPLEGSRDGRKALLYRLLMVPELRAQYLGYVRDVAENWLTWDRLGPICEDYRDLIREVMQGDNRKLYSTQQFESGADSSLRTFVEARRAFLLDWLDTNAEGARL